MLKHTTRLTHVKSCCVAANVINSQRRDAYKNQNALAAVFIQTLFYLLHTQEPLFAQLLPSRSQTKKKCVFELVAKFSSVLPVVSVGAKVSRIASSMDFLVRRVFPPECVKIPSCCLSCFGKYAFLFSCIRSSMNSWIPCSSASEPLAVAQILTKFRELFDRSFLFSVHKFQLAV